MEPARTGIPAQIVHLVTAAIEPGAKLAALFGQGEGPGKERADARHIGDDDADILFNAVIATLAHG